jgi:transcriptional regulator with XRE-family HTH domain
MKGKERMFKVMTRLPQLLAAKEIRDNRRYTQKEVADASGVSPTLISNWMNGKNVERSTVETVLRVADWLGCTLDELIVRVPEGEAQ